VIRTAVLATLLASTALSALAFERTSIPASQASGPGSRIHFTDFAGVARLAPEGATEPFRFGGAQQDKATVVYELPKGKPAGRIDVTSPRDNPFMAQPEAAPAPAQ
jgi:hypothetical protein